MSSPFPLRRGRLAAMLLTAVVAALIPASGSFEASAVNREHFQGTVVVTAMSALLIESAPDFDLVLFRVESQTQILKDGEKVALAEIRSGDGVMVEATSKENERTATVIAARTPY